MTGEPLGVRKLKRAVNRAWATAPPKAGAVPASVTRAVSVPDDLGADAAAREVGAAAFTVGRHIGFRAGRA